MNTGDVIWVNQTNATSMNLAYVNGAGRAIIKVDNTSFVPFNEKRNTVRITTKDFYDFGSLWIIDVVHLPYGCSVCFHSLGMHFPLTHERINNRSGRPSGPKAPRGQTTAKSISSKLSISCRQINTHYTLFPVVGTLHLLNNSANLTQDRTESLVRIVRRNPVVRLRRPGMGVLEKGLRRVEGEFGRRSLM